MSIGERWLIKTDTIKVRMQLSKRAKAPGVRSQPSILTSLPPPLVSHNHTNSDSKWKHFSPA